MTALRKVLPQPLGPEDISVRINSPIVGEDHIRTFVSSLLGGRAEDIEILHLSINGRWEIKAWGTDWNKRSQEYGTEDLDAIGIINLMMNGKPVKVFDKDENDKPVLNPEKTALVESKAEAINAPSWSGSGRMLSEPPTSHEDTTRCSIATSSGPSPTLRGFLTLGQRSSLAAALSPIP